MSVVRTRLISTALELFLHEGLQSVGIDRILKQANVSKMTLYKYFPAKENLIEEVLRTYHQQIINELQRSLDQPVTDLQAHLELLFQWYNRNFVISSVRGCLFSTAALVYFDPAHPIHKVSIEHKQKLLAMMTHLLGAHGFEQPERLAMKCLLVIEGARNLHDIGVSGNPLGSAVEAIHALLRAYGQRQVA